jgi:hypothetical protein
MQRPIGVDEAELPQAVLRVTWVGQTTLDAGGRPFGMYVSEGAVGLTGLAWLPKGALPLR